ncbi:MAG TPA: NAD-dependent deacylase [Flavobacterium sp.]|jgi:NAD-dependent deacetylase
MSQKKKLVVLTGAGISAESGVPTFRDSNGLWEGHEVMTVATPEGFQNNPELVLDFYNQRRKQLHLVQPNQGHLILAELENDYDVYIITQNVDNLHEKAGSSNVLHLHGELLKVRSVSNSMHILDWHGDLKLTDKDPEGNQLRPHIVWFGEEVPALEEAVDITEQADIFAVIGTSLQVYPAAGLVQYANPNIPIFYVDPNPAPMNNVGKRLTVIAEPASTGVAIFREKLASIDF